MRFALGVEVRGPCFLRLACFRARCAFERGVVQLAAPRSLVHTSDRSFSAPTGWRIRTPAWRTGYRKYQRCLVRTHYSFRNTGKWAPFRYNHSCNGKRSSTGYSGPNGRSRVTCRSRWYGNYSASRSRNRTVRALFMGLKTWYWKSRGSKTRLTRRLVAGPNWNSSTCTGFPSAP